jgi:beta-lactamase class D
MRRLNVVFCLFFGVVAPYAAENSAQATSFLARENGHVLLEEGDTNVRHSPCSTFKIALSAMGYDAGILKDETRPTWDFKPGCFEFLPIWKQPHDPTLWMKNSCVWYSQVLTPQLGMEKFQKYVSSFDYGNCDLSGDPGQNNGLTKAWLGSSLLISTSEQVAFLEKLLKCQLPVSSHAHEMTKKILYRETLSNGWKLYGKTGANECQGWFVGWIEKDERTIVFAHHIADDGAQPNHGARAKEAAIAKLSVLVS